MRIIPVNEPFIGPEEMEYVKEAVSSGWISSEGEFIKIFEEKFSVYIQKKHGITVNNGTNALILALKALGLPEGSQVIMPSFTIISCALACLYNGLVPIFVDSEKETWNIDVDAIEDKINERTKAIMPVHIFGHPVNVGEIKRIAQKYDLYIIEDFAEAIGSEYKGEKCGSFGDISCTSFYANKLVTTGEGGMCLTDSPIFNEKMRRLKNLAFRAEERFVHHEAGFNFRMTNIQAAIGLAQVERIEQSIRRKIRIAESYSFRLKEIEKEGKIFLPIEKEGAKNTFWMYGIVLNSEKDIDAEQVRKKLSREGVQTRPFFYPMHLQPLFSSFSWHKQEQLPVSEDLYKYGLYLPSGLTLEDRDIEYVVDKVRKVLA